MRQHRPSSWPAWVLPMCLCALASGCAEPEQGNGGPPPTEVGVVELDAQPITVTDKLPGRTSAYLISEVRPQINGIIQKRLFDEGATVKAGSVLYQIDPAPYQAAYDSAAASLSSAEANLASAQLLAERYSELVKIEAVSKQQGDDAQSAYQQSRASVASAQAALKSARINLGYTRITAPIGGQVSTSAYTPGALVTANQAEALTTVVQLDPIYVDITQSSAELLALKRRFAAGQLQRAGQNRIAVRLLLEDGSDYDAAGTLEFTGVSVDQSTGAVTLRAVFPNPDHLLLPGMYVQALVEQGVDQRGLLVPQVGVTHNPHGEAVAMLVNADNKVEQRTIEIGRAIGDQWVVKSGLSAGDRVIVDHLQKVRPGAEVKPVPPGAGGMQTPDGPPAFGE